MLRHKLWSSSVADAHPTRPVVTECGGLKHMWPSAKGCFQASPAFASAAPSSFSVLLLCQPSLGQRSTQQLLGFDPQRASRLAVLSGLAGSGHLRWISVCMACSDYKLCPVMAPPHGATGGVGLTAVLQATHCALQQNARRSDDSSGPPCSLPGKRRSGPPAQLQRPGGKDSHYMIQI